MVSSLQEKETDDVSTGPIEKRDGCKVMRRGWSGRLTLLLDDVLKEALLIVAFGDDIDEDVVLFPHAVNLIVLILDDGALSMPRDALVHVLLLRDVFAVRVRECCP